MRGAQAERPRWWWVLCVGACLLGMATKEVMVSAPLLVLPRPLYDRALPKAKLLVGTPNARYVGTLTIDGNLTLGGATLDWFVGGHGRVGLFADVALLRSIGISMIITSLITYISRTLAIAQEIIAALVIIAGAVWSAWRVWRGRNPSLGGQRTIANPGRLVWGNLLIATGTLVLSGSGTLAGRLGKDRAFAVTLLVGIVILSIMPGVIEYMRHQRTKRTDA